MTSSSWYRRSLWNYKGAREYTKAGYDYASAKFVAEDLDVDCTDRHYMITGCNRGIGFAIAVEVARRGGVLHMVCRNKDAAQAARSEIITTTGNDKIYLHIVDLSMPVELAYWAQKFAAQHEKLHVLVNNAGVLNSERKFDEYGIESSFAVNVLAVYILNITLLPILQRNEDSRIITVSSAGMLTVRLDPLDIMHAKMEPFNGLLVYSQNKRQQVVMTLWFAQRYENVQFSCMHPGWADTLAVRQSLPEFYETMKDNLRSPAEGADTAVWLAVSKAALRHPSGLFFQDREPVPTHLPLAWTKSDVEEEDQLMQNIENIRLKVLSHLPELIQKEEENESLVKETEAKKDVAEASLTVLTTKPEENIKEVVKEKNTPVEPIIPPKIKPPPEPIVAVKSKLPVEPEPIALEELKQPFQPTVLGKPKLPVEPKPIDLEEFKQSFEPTVPEKPKLPVEPKPVASEEPKLPFEPIVPGKPKLPVEPEPIAPEEPIQSAAATDPEKPKLPAEVIVPAKPKQLAELITPEKSKLLDEPVKSELLAEPPVSGKSEKPSEPAAPEIPILSDEPVALVKPKLHADEPALVKTELSTEADSSTKPIVPAESASPARPEMPSAAADPTASTKSETPSAPAPAATTKPLDPKEEVVAAAELISPEKANNPDSKPVAPAEAAYVTPVKPKMDEVATTHAPTSSPAHKEEDPKTTLPMEEQHK